MEIIFEISNKIKVIISTKEQLARNSRLFSTIKNLISLITKGKLYY